MTTTGTTGDRARLAGHGALLAPAMLAGSALGYVFAVLAARLLAPASFGALGALLSLLLVLAIPGIALQATTARRIARAGDVADASADWGTGRRRAVRLSVVLVLIVLSVGPALLGFLAIDDRRVLVGLVLAVLGQPSAAATHAALQGRRLMPQLAGFLLGSGVVKFGLAGAAVIAGGGPAGAIAGLGLGECANAAIGRWLAGRHLDPRRRRDAAPPLAEVVAAGVAVAGILALTNVDVLLARHHLEPAASGLYAAGATIARVLFWAPQFISVLVYPRVAAGAGRRVIDASTAAVLAVSAAIIGVLALAGPALARLVFGPAYLELGDRLWIFAVLGTSLALLQLLVLAQVARDDRRIGLLLVAAVVTEVVVISLYAHDSIEQIVGTTATVAVVVLLLSLARARRRVP